MNPEEIIARERERIGRPLTAAEKAEIRGGATRLESVATVADFNEAPAETSAERTAREAREASAAAAASNAALAGNDSGIGDWLSGLPDAVRGERSEGVHPVRAALADWLESGRSGTSGLVEGATLGLSDEVAGAVEAIASDPGLALSAATGGDITELEEMRRRYREARDRRRATMAEHAAENPILFGLGTVVGGAAVPLPGAGAVARGATVGGRIVRGAGLGAAAGGVGAYGASTRETTDPAIAGDVAEGAALGAAGGAAATGLAEGVGAAVRAAPGVRAGANRALLEVPNGPVGAAHLVEELGTGVGASREASAAEAVRRSGAVGPFSSPADVEARAARGIAAADSAPYERAMEGLVVDRGRLARAMEGIAASGERTRLAAPGYAPIREAAGRMAPAPRPAPPPRAPSRALPPPAEVPGTPTRPDAPRGIGRPTRAVESRTERMSLPPETAGRAPMPMAPEFTDVGRRSTVRAGGGLEAPPEGLPPPEMSEGTIPPGFGPEAAGEEPGAISERLRAWRERGAPVDEIAEEVTGAGRGRRGRIREAFEPHEPLPAGALEGVDDHLRDIAEPLGRPRGRRRAAGPMPPAEPPTPAPRTTLSGRGDLPEVPASTTLPVETGTMPPTGGYRAPAVLVSRPDPRPPVVRPAAERPLGARFYEGPGVRPDDVVPVWTPPAPGSSRRAGDGSLMEELRAAREFERAAATGAERSGPTERGWRDVGRMMRETADEAFERRYGPEAMERYRAARAGEALNIPIEREARRGALRAAGTPPGTSVAELGAGWAGGPVAYGLATALRGRARAINAATRGLAASALESPTASAAARAAPEVSRRLTAGGGTAAGAGVSREATADERRRSLLREILGSESRLAPPPEPDVISGASTHVEPTASGYEAPSGSASPTTRTPTTRSRRPMSSRARDALRRILGRH